MLTHQRQLYELTQNNEGFEFSFDKLLFSKDDLTISTLNDLRIPFQEIFQGKLEVFTNTLPYKVFNEAQDFLKLSRIDKQADVLILNLSEKIHLLYLRYHLREFYQDS